MKGDFRESVEAETVLREKLKAAEAALDEERRRGDELEAERTEALDYAARVNKQRLDLDAALTAEQQAHRALRSWADGAEVDLDALQAELAAEQQAHERTRAEDELRVVRWMQRSQVAEATLEAARVVIDAAKALWKPDPTKRGIGFGPLADAIRAFDALTSPPSTPD